MNTFVKGDAGGAGVRGNDGDMGPPGVVPIHTQSALDAAVRQARVEGITVGAQQAQERISAILTHKEAEGRSTLAQHLAFKTMVSAEDAIATLTASEKATAAAPTNTGRSRDAAGGLALADTTHTHGDQQEGNRKPSPVAIDSNKIYAKFGGRQK